MGTIGKGGIRLLLQPDTIKMTRLTLDRRQVRIYLAAILCGLGLGTALGDAAKIFKAPLWPVPGLLLFTTITQVSLNQLRDAFRDRRFMAVVPTGNFVAIPLSGNWCGSCRRIRRSG